MKIFVSGGAGFIGSHLVQRLIDTPNITSIVVYDNFTSGSMSHLSAVKDHSKLTVVDGDIKHLGMLTDAMRGADRVFHFAANPDIAKAVKQPDIDFWEGTYLTQNILEAMRVNQVGSLLYTSGSGVYGEVPAESFKESFGPCFPISTYGASKLACEALISSYCYMFGMRARAFRFANVVGPKQTHGVGYDFIRRLLDDPSTLRILGDGTQSKSYIYVEDVIRAMLLAAEQLAGEAQKPMDVFNVATDDYITVTEIADIACNVAQLDTRTVGYQYTGGDRGWKGDVPCVLFDVEKIKALGWQAQRNARQAIHDSIQSMYQELVGEVLV
ncbi:MAG: NAD-dependent epimerase/dehydratase family protein [Coxiellaceae bacterium]|nr:NAD-dependent epimerase/dehydratase family protein [Coxiellaceae bacterium]